MKHFAWPTALMSLFLLLFAAPNQAMSLPNFAGVVLDEANVIDTNDEAILGLRLLDYEQITKARFLVHTTNKLGEQKIEDYGRSLLAHWHMEGKADPATVLLILSPGAGKVRWQLNPAAQEIFPIEKQNRILKEIMLPYFGKAEFSAGLSRGLDAAANILTSDNSAFAENNLLPGFAKTTPVQNENRLTKNSFESLDFARLEWLLVVLFGLLLACFAFVIPYFTRLFVDHHKRSEKSELRPVGFGGRLSSTSW